MLMFDNFLFDLDGTLTDSKEGIINSIKYALNKFNYELTDQNTLNKFIGPPLVEGFMKYCGFSGSDALLALKYYREYFSVKGMFENNVYEGIEDVLYKLKINGKKLYVATAKPEKYSLEILEHFKLDKYFEQIVGATFDEKINNKKDVITYALKRCAIKELNMTVMIGDREDDITGAKINGIKSIGVLYGYGSTLELKKAGADFMVGSPNEILRFI